ncbi:MAG TPA: hypothetical protein VFW00_01460 [Rhodocyclaceae bacterium]|nr:hypothetical protein [Rhodocyclaceae bacterium]
MSPLLASRLARLDKMTQRERWVVGLCVCVVTWFLIDTLLVSPSEREQRTFQQLLVAQREQLASASAQLDGIHSGRTPVGDPVLLNRLSQIEKENVSADASLRASQQYLVPPEMMGALLQDILRRDNRLELVSLQTLAVAPIVASSADAQSAPVAASATDAIKTDTSKTDKDATSDTNMFRHGVELVVRGNYLDVMSYLQEVEKLPWQMYWGRFVMEAGGPGQPVFHVSLYTLSLDKSWLIL